MDKISLKSLKVKLLNDLERVCNCYKDDNPEMAKGLLSNVR